MHPVSCGSLSAHVEVMTHPYRNIAAAKCPWACYPTWIQEWRAKIVINNHNHNHK